jgi:hypothetical protein
VPGVGSITQSLGAGEFYIYDSAGSLYNSTGDPLLSGTVAGATLNLTTGPGADGSVLSLGNVTYDPSTPLYTAFSNAGDVNPGDFVFSLTGFGAGQPSITTSFSFGGISIGTLNPFSATLGGVYDADPPAPTPLPSSCGSGLAVLFGMGAAGVLIRHHRALA